VLGEIMTNQLKIYSKQGALLAWRLFLEGLHIQVPKHEFWRAQ
jgi:hypothetical protein